MNAIRFHASGGPEVLEYTSVPRPEPDRGEALVRVEAAGVNFIDTYQRSGAYPVPLPATPGSEAAGTVVALGDGVRNIVVGDRVAWTGLVSIIIALVLWIAWGGYAFAVLNASG